MTWEFAVGIFTGIVIWWSLTKLVRAAAFGGSKVGSQARQKWLSKMDYESLLQTKGQIDREISKRQPASEGTTLVRREPQ